MHDYPINSVPPSWWACDVILEQQGRWNPEPKKKEVTGAHKSWPNIVLKILSILSTSKQSFLAHQRQCTATARAICLFGLLATENPWKCVCPLYIVLPAYSSEQLKCKCVCIYFCYLCSTLSAWKRWLLKCPVNITGCEAQHVDSQHVWCGWVDARPGPTES